MLRAPIANLILEFASLEDLLHISTVNKQFYFLTKQRAHWKVKVLNQFIGVQIALNFDKDTDIWRNFYGRLRCGIRFDKQGENFEFTSVFAILKSPELVLPVLRLQQKTFPTLVQDVLANLAPLSPLIPYRDPNTNTVSKYLSCFSQQNIEVVLTCYCNIVAAYLKDNPEILLDNYINHWLKYSDSIYHLDALFTKQFSDSDFSIFQWLITFWSQHVYGPLKQALFCSYFSLFSKELNRIKIGEENSYAAINCLKLFCDCLCDLSVSKKSVHFLKSLAFVEEGPILDLRNIILYAGSQKPNSSNTDKELKFVAAVTIPTTFNLYQVGRLPDTESFSEVIVGCEST